MTMVKETRAAARSRLGRSSPQKRAIFPIGDDGDAWSWYEVIKYGKDWNGGSMKFDSGPELRVMKRDCMQILPNGKLYRYG